jgi:hypothetical protein
VAPPSARRAGRLFRLRRPRVPGGGRRHGRAHGSFLFSGVSVVFTDACCYSRRGRTLPRAAAGAPCWCFAVRGHRPRCPAALRAVSRPRQKSACWWPKACAPLVARRASFAAAPPLLRGNRDLEKLCGKSHVNTSRVTPFFWHPLHKEGQRLEPLPILPKILEVQRAVADARGLQECSPKSPQRRVPTDPGSGGGARATNCLGKPEIGRLGTCRLENGRLWEGLVRVCPVRTPRTLRAGKVLASWNLAFKTPQPPALPEAAHARDAPAAQIAR